VCDGVSHLRRPYFIQGKIMYKIFIAILLVTFCLNEATARRLKIYSYSKTVAPGQYAYVIFENPNTDIVIARAKCDAEKLMALTRMDVPTLRIDQNGKQIFTALGSYRSMGDSCVATWLVPTALTAGAATLFVINDREASTPYVFSVDAKMQCRLVKVTTPAIKASELFTVVAEGYVPVDTMDRRNTLEKLRVNFAYDKLSKSEQFIELNKKMKTNWTMVSTGNILTITQGSSTWTVFVEGCGIDKDGVTLDFTAPSDIKPGPATMTLSIRYNNNDVAKSEPMTVVVQ
jgi:hypothetical protein